MAASKPISPLSEADDALWFDIQPAFGDLNLSLGCPPLGRGAYPHQPVSQGLRCEWIRSLKEKWTLSDPCFSISALPHQRPRSGLGSGPLRKELAITRLDWSLAPSPRSGEQIARQNPFEPPLGFRLASSCPGLDRLVSSMYSYDFRHFHTLHLAPCGVACLLVSLCLQVCHFQACHSYKLPGPCFQTERATLITFPRTATSRWFPSERIDSSGPHSSITVWFQALFTPISGYFSVFRHRTSALSVLRRIQSWKLVTPNFPHPNQGTVVWDSRHNSFWFAFTGLSPSVAGLFKPFQLRQ
eukprot:TRINITY_DN2189_c0_g1_i1.p1 TRINITY_DN2189_c0_g1~~TRINITY_DN2189_c0_g1_i1.p1  ORF type:complete len:299 (-),score=-93.95 TRINITY_DN2189_c0_g1_i1:673-1569(-)